MQRFTAFVFQAALLVAAGCGVSGDELETEGSDYAGGPASDDDGGGGESGDDGSGDGGSDPGGAGDESGAGTDEPSSGPEGVLLSTGCSPYGSDVYTPFPGYGPVTTGTVSSFPWRGPTTYPDSVEDFRMYGPSLPQQVECGGNKAARDHVDVTAGCLTAVSQGGDKRGQIQLTSDGYYRSFALPHDAASDRPVAWGNQGVEYRFFYTGWTGTEGNPGFKAFVRYMTEYDLYVASWRRDGVVQIQKKHCGVYTTLKRDPTYGAPSLNTWHTIRFEVVGSELRLYLDGRLAMTTTDTSIKHGTAGIRIDSANGSLIDDWKTYAP